MNTGKQVNAMVLVLFVLLIAYGAYTIWDPFRSDAAKDDQLDKALTRGAVTFTLNCRLCHGDSGQGPPGSGRLAAALPLDTQLLQGILNGAYDKATFDKSFKLVTNTVMCGRVGTVMPTWGADQGGTLNEEQIRQLAVLITHGGWDFAREHADEVDATATHNAKLDMAGGLSADATELTVSDASSFTLGQYIRIKVDDETEERMRILPSALRVERGVNGTDAVKHARSTPLVGQGTGERPKEGQPAEQSLTEPIDKESTLVVISRPKQYRADDIIQLEDEQMRVVDVVRGLPTTGEFLAKDIGREPKRLLVTYSDGIEVGSIIRLGGELIEVRQVSDDGDTGAQLDADVPAFASRISVDDPAFFAENYVIRLDDELMQVVGPVETGQLLSETIGHAQTNFTISGTEGIQEGMIIRMGGELMRVKSVVQPARLEVDRGASDSTAASHGSGAALFELVQSAANQTSGNGQEAAPEFSDSEQTTLGSVGAGDKTINVSAISGITVGGTYRIDGELVKVAAADPAVISVERAVDGTERAAHSRRAVIYERNLLAVQRGVHDTTPAAHSQSTPVRMTQLSVKRAAQGTKPLEHAKNAEIFTGNTIIVERGQRSTDAVEHPDGALIRDFPPPPDEPAIVQETCGQKSVGGAPTGEQPTPVPGATDIDVSLIEFEVDSKETSAPVGPVTFNVTNDGTSVHNFRVIQTDLAPADLPVANSQVDETQVNVVGGVTGAITVGTTQTVSLDLAPGKYVLICNVSGHYQQGMHAQFEVTGP